MSEPKQRFSASLAADAVYTIYSPAVHPTVVVDRVPETAPAR